MELAAEATSPGVTREQSTSGQEVAAGGDARLACGRAEWKRLPHRARYLTWRSLHSGHSALACTLRPLLAVHLTEP